jgi:CRP/FNR family transcriptional regulator
MTSVLSSFPTAQLRLTAIASTLRGCQLFAGLPVPDLSRIASITVVKALDKGDYLFHEGDVSHGFYVVQRGAINLHRVNNLGKEQVIHIFRTGESFAEATLATLSGYPGDARAAEPSQVLLVQKHGFLDLVKHQPELALRMLASAALHMRILIAQLEDLTLKDVETRLASWLLKRCPDITSQEPVVIQLTSTKRVIAAELGTVSETFSRTLAKFREAHLIQVDGRTMTVLSPARLRAAMREP